jgi:hypothetical protein
MIKFFAPQTRVGLALLTTASVITQSIFIVGLQERRKKYIATLTQGHSDNNHSENTQAHSLTCSPRSNLSEPTHASSPPPIMKR